MKLTIVIDTDDPDGILDSLKIVKHFARKYRGHTGRGAGVTFSKIPFIKMLRKFAKHAKEAEELGIDSAGLRFTKEWADEIFSEHML